MVRSVTFINMYSKELEPFSIRIRWNVRVKRDIGVRRGVISGGGKEDHIKDNFHEFLDMTSYFHMFLVI